MLWTTRKNVGIDRMACAWLIKKYIDAEAVFSFIDYGESAAQETALLFDVPGCQYSHRRGRCSFHTLLKEYKLHDSILDQIARMIDGVDCANEIVPLPESYGLEAICLGTRACAGNDQDALSQGMRIYDALYAYLKNKSQNE